MQPYAFKQMVAGFGFGGIPEYQEKDVVNHCFCLNGDKDNDPTIIGLEALAREYKRAVKGTKMWGPTLFSPMLQVMLDYM